MLATREFIHESCQGQRLREALPRWLAGVPLYRGAGALALESLRQGVGDPLSLLPLISKRHLREGFPENFLGDRGDLDDLLDAELVELEHTSGTSEGRMPLLLGLGWWAEQEARALRINPLVARVLDEMPGARRVTIASPVCNNDVCYTGVPSREERTVGSALFLSLSRFPFLWSDADLARMASEAADWKPEFLDVDPVYGAVFARYCRRHGIRFPTLRFIVSSYEFVSRVHRRALERAFGVPVLNLYGSTETGHLLMEDEAGRLAPSLDTAVLEVINRDASGVGELVVTTLTNEYMPLIRYQIGDLVEKIERPYLSTYVLHGRADDALFLPGGDRVTVWQIDRCFEGIPGILHYQLRQEADARWQLFLVPEGGDVELLNLPVLRQRLTDLAGGGCNLAIRTTEALLPEPSGKFRLCCPAA